jgi:hypothetical protein
MQSCQRKIVAIALTAAATFAACRGKSPTSPTTPGPAPAGPTGAVAGITLTGPGTVPLGQTVQFTAIAQQADGATRDVTREAAWSSFNSSVLGFVSPGQFTGRAKGQTGVRVSFSGRSATMADVVIVPEGTFRLIGTVRDAGAPIEADVRIDDEALGRTEVRTAAGRYSVFGVRGNTRVTIEKSGYEPAVASLVIQSHQTIDVDLALARSRTDLSGRYILTIATSPDCPGLPAALASRSYPATVTQSGAAVTVTLEGTQFVSSGGRTLNRFTGFVEAERVVFRLAPTLDYYYYFYFLSPDVLELVGPNSHYAFDGTAVAALGGTALSGTLSGSILNLAGPPYRLGTRCGSASHRFVLARSTT